MNRSNNLWMVLSRVAAYSAAMFASMLFSRQVMHGTYTSHLSVFLVLSLVIELLWSRLDATCARTWLYVVSVLGVALSGSLLVREAGQVIHSEHQLRVQADRINEIVTHMPSAVFAVNEEGVICAVNSGMLSLTGYDSGDLLGRSVAVLFPDSDCDARLNKYRQDVQRMRKDSDKGWIVQREPHLRLKKRDGRVISADASMFALRHVVGAQNTHNDIHFITIVAVHGAR